jgi:hypothetical protein
LRPCRCARRRVRSVAPRASLSPRANPGVTGRRCMLRVAIDGFLAGSSRSGRRRTTTASD